MEYQMWVHFTWALVFVWNDAADEMWAGRFEVGHESAERFAMKRRDGSHGATLLLLLLTTGGLCLLVGLGLVLGGQVVSPDGLHEHEAGLLQELDNGVVQWILVLLEPVGNVVTDATGVVVKFEVNITLTLGLGRGLTELWGLAHVGLVELVTVGLVGSFWEHALFFKGGHDTEWLLNELDTSGQIHTEIDGLPVDTFLGVLFLFKNEHMVVEELLELLVGEVDAQLLEGVETEDFETGNIETTDEEGSWQLGGQSFVTVLGDPVEQSLEDTLGESSSTVVDLLWGLTLANVFGTDLDSWLAQVLAHIGRVQAEEVGGLVGGFSAVKFTLLLTLLLLEFHTLEVHDSGGDLVNTLDVFSGELEDFEGLLGGVQLITIIEVWYGDLTLADGWVCIWIWDEKASLDELWLSLGENLVEDVVVSLTLELEGDTGLLEKVGLDITGTELTGWAEVNSDKLTESGRVIVTGGLGVTKGLHSWVSGDNLVFKRLLVGLSGTGSGNEREVLDDLLGVDGLTGTGLTSNQHRLVVSIHQHVLVSVVGNAVQMWWHFGLSLATVAIDHELAVYWQHLVWVDSDTEKTRVGVDHEYGVSISEVEEDGSFVQEGHVGHVLDLLHLGWVDLLLEHLLFLHLDFLLIAKSLDGGHAAFDVQKETLFVGSVGLWAPNKLLTLVHLGLTHKLELFLVRHTEVLGGIAELLQESVTVHFRDSVLHDL